MNNRSMGIIVFCIWAIVSGLLIITNITFAFAAPLLAILLIAAGILILLGK